MTRRIHLTAFATAAVVAIATSQAQAQNPNLYWQGGDGVLTAANYTDLVTPNLAPTASDIVFFGGNGATGVTGTLTPADQPLGPTQFHRLTVGHNEAAVTTPTDLRGEGILTVSNGAQLNLTGATGAVNAGLTVGNARDGILNIDGVGSSVTSSNQVLVGFASSQLNRSGTINVTNGGALIITDGSLDLGTNDGGATSNGMQGHLVVSGEGSLVQILGTNTNANLNIGIRKATSSVIQSGGSIEIDNHIEVGFNGNGATLAENPTFSISGGTTKMGFNFFVGRGNSTGATVNITGGEVSVGTPATETAPAQGRYLMGGSTATGIVTHHSGGTLNTVLDVRVADASTSATSVSTYNLSGTGVINSTTGGYVGRQGIGRFFQTGGIANFNGNFNIGNRESTTGANDGLYEISAGDLNFGANLNIATSGIGQFRVVGDDGTIDVAGALNLNTSGNGNGTLAYELETGDALSTINVVGAATFASGTSLILDETNASPGQSSYDLLTASDIIDNGIVFAGPAGWTMSIVSGGLGEILKVSAPGSVEDADFDQDGDIDGADFLTWQRNVDKTSGAQLGDGDANGDGAVNNDDLDIFKGQYGTSTFAATAVPEPAAALLLLLGISCGAAWRRR